MKKSTQTALLVVGGAAVLYYLMKQNSTNTGATPPLMASNQPSNSAGPACNVSAIAGQAECLVTSLFGSS